MKQEFISFEDFEKVDIRIGTIVSVTDFPKAKKPAYQLKVDFGNLGLKNSSAQITSLYNKQDLLHKQVIAIVNFEKKQIANFISECLVLGIQNGKDVVLLQAQKTTQNGKKVS
jgi:tRNA-binding protein